MRNCSFYSPVRRGYIRKVSIYLVQNIFRMIAVLIVFLAANKKKESGENYIKKRQRIDRDEKVLLLETRQKGKSTLRCCGQSIGPVVNPLPPPSLSPIPWTRRLSSSNAYVVIVLVFVLIFLRRRLCRCHRLLGPFVKPPLPPSLSLIPHMHRTSVVVAESAVPSYSAAAAAAAITNALSP